MKQKLKLAQRCRKRTQLAPLQPKGKGMAFANAKRIHLTGGGWAA